VQCGKAQDKGDSACLLVENGTKIGCIYGTIKPDTEKKVSASPGVDHHEDNNDEDSNTEDHHEDSNTEDHGKDTHEEGVDEDKHGKDKYEKSHGKDKHAKGHGKDTHEEGVDDIEERTGMEMCISHVHTICSDYKMVFDASKTMLKAECVNDDETMCIPAFEKGAP